MKLSNRKGEGYSNRDRESYNKIGEIVKRKRGRVKV